MTGHAHEMPPHGVLPDAICPGIEVLVHRRATELITPRPRRRVATASSLGGIAVAAICAVLVLVIGSPSGSGLLSPRQAVAAVAETLGGNGILHWVRSGDLVASPDQADRPGTLLEEEWTDLATGDSHLVETRTPSEGEPQKWVRWIAADGEWVALAPDPVGVPRIQLKPRFAGQDAATAVEAVRSLLQRAEQGDAEIAAGGEEGGRPLVVVTERREGAARRVWITREEQPQVVRSEIAVDSRNASRAITTTTTTKTWRVLPRTQKSLAAVEIPRNAQRVP